MKYIIITLVFFMFAASGVSAQVIVSGKVYDGSEHIIMSGVSVEVQHTTNGQMTDEHGKFYIHANLGDTILFSFIGFGSHRMAIPKDAGQFFSEDIYLMPKELNLPEVQVRTFKSYHEDSVENRRVNQEIFDYKQKSIGTKLFGPILSQFGIKQKYQRASNPNTLSRFQDRLIEEEHQRYIDQRFTKELVESVTGLCEPALDKFMKKYRPSYDALVNSSDYEFLEQMTIDKEKFERESSE